MATMCFCQLSEILGRERTSLFPCSILRTVLRCKGRGWLLDTPPKYGHHGYGSGTTRLPSEAPYRRLAAPSRGTSLWCLCLSPLVPVLGVGCGTNDGTPGGGEFCWWRSVCSRSNTGTNIRTGCLVRQDWQIWRRR